MKILKIFTPAILAFSFSVSCAAQMPGGSRTQIRERKPPQAVASDEAARVGTIAEGTDASVTTPFVFVARTPETLAQLKKLVKNLPDKTIDLNRTAVVAAFAGEKNTGGYSLKMAEHAGRISVKTVAPPKDALVAQVITTPYKVALVNVEREDGLDLDLSADFTSASKNYRLTSGVFESSGGIAGGRKKFAAQGTIRVLNWGEYLTLVFNLTGKAGESKRKLFETASGVAQGGKISLKRVEAADFIDRPHPFLLANGTVSGNKISLFFVPGETGFAVSDGYFGTGNLEAVKIK